MDFEKAQPYALLTFLILNRKSLSDLPIKNVKKKDLAGIKFCAIGGGVFFFYLQITQWFAVQDQAQRPNGFPLNPILNTETSPLL